MSVHRGFSDEAYNDNSKSREESGVWKLFKRRLKTNPGVFKTQNFFLSQLASIFLLLTGARTVQELRFPRILKKISRMSVQKENTTL